MNEKALTVNNLTKIYDNKIILKNLSLDLNWGEITTIFGPNGSGKSTLIRIIGNITDFDEGEIYFQNINTKQLNKNIRRKIGIVTHQTFLYDHLTVQENLQYYCQIFGINNSKSALATTLNKVNLDQFKDTLVRKLSKGTQQRVSLARAIIHQPQILLLDEPDSGLDSRSLEILKDIIYQHQLSGGSALIATHNLEFGISVSKTLLILSDRRIVYTTDSKTIDHELFNYEYQKITKEKL